MAADAADAQLLVVHSSPVEKKKKKKKKKRERETSHGECGDEDSNMSQDEDAETKTKHESSSSKKKEKKARKKVSHIHDTHDILSLLSAYTTVRGREYCRIMGLPCEPTCTYAYFACICTHFNTYTYCTIVSTQSPFAV